MNYTVPFWRQFQPYVKFDVFNLFNNQNYYVFNTVYGNGAAPAASFLRPVGGVANVDPARQFTFGAKFIF